MTEVVDVDLALHGELREVAEGLVVAEARHEEGLFVDVGHIGGDDRHEHDVGGGGRLEHVAVALHADGEAVTLALLKLGGVGDHEFGFGGDKLSRFDGDRGVGDAIRVGGRKDVGGAFLLVVGVEQVGRGLEGGLDGRGDLGRRGSGEAEAVVALEALAYGVLLHGARDVDHIAVVAVAFLAGCHENGGQGEDEIFYFVHCCLSFWACR